METIYRVKSMDELAKHWADRAAEAREEANSNKNKQTRRRAEARAATLEGSRRHAEQDHSRTMTRGRLAKLKWLEAENAQLRTSLVNLMLQNQALRESIEKERANEDTLAPAVARDLATTKT